MRATGESKAARCSYKHHALEPVDELRRHIAAGKQCDAPGHDVG